MTNRKTTTKPAELTVAVIAPDEAFGNDIIATRDAAVVNELALRNERTSREAYHDREIARAMDKRDRELRALDKKIGEQARIQAGCDAALAAITGKQETRADIGEALRIAAENVVPMTAAE